MKQIKFDEHIKKKEKFKRIRLEKGLSRLPRAKSKNSEETKVLHKLIEERRKRWLLEGKLERIGPRAWRVNL